MVNLLVVILIAALLVSASLYLHYAVLRKCARLIFSGEMKIRRPIIFVMSMIFIAHLAEVMLFALTYYLLHWHTSLGVLQGASAGDASGMTGYFYFSISSYTTLGVGDILPIGTIRILAGIEALTGLVLIAWSASFSYLMMEKLWREPELES